MQQHHRSALLGQRSAWLAAPLVAALLLGTAACGSGDKPAGGSKQSAKPSASADPQAGEKRKILAVVENANSEQNRMYATGRMKGTRFEEYVTDKAYSKITGQVADYKMAGVVFKGEKKVSDAKVTALDTKAKPKKAKVETCVDTSSWKPVKKDGGDPIKVLDKNRKFITTEELESDGDTWMVTDFHPHKDRKC